jgi:drug/metabolite transporter (DMT)-like permease
MNRKKGFLALFISGIIYGSFGIWIRILSIELTSFQQIAFRNFIGLVLALCITILLKQSWSLKKANKISLLLYTTLFPVAIIFFTFAMLGTKISTALFAFYASSLIVSLIVGKVVFHDQITFNKALGLVITFIGLIFFTYPFSIASLNLGFIFGLISGIFDSLTNIFRRNLGGKVDNFVLTTIQMFGGLTVAGILILITKQNWPASLSNTTLFSGLILGVLLMIVTYLMLVGFQNIEINVGTIIFSSELFFATVFAAIIFNEYPTSAELIGGLLIMISIIISNISLFRNLDLKLYKPHNISIKKKP